MHHLLEDKDFKKKLKAIAAESNLSYAQACDEAEVYMKELYSTQSTFIDAVSTEIFQYVLSRGYEKSIDVNPAEMKTLAGLMRRHPVAFVMTHKTYIDMIVLAIALARHGLPIPHIFAGINMAFLGLGELGRKAGVIFIRRSFKDNLVYKATLRQFIASRVNDRADFMWAIEGTRSRTGKLVWPKMGILKYIVEAEKQSAREVKYVPVSVVYDLIPDVDEMTKEGRGKDKKPESLLWFLDYMRKMGNNFGKISIRFGEPVQMNAEVHAEIPDDEDDGQERKYTLPLFAFELIHAINNITPVTTASLVCTTLLSKFALTKRQLESDIVAYMQLIENHRADVLVDRGKAIGSSVQHAIGLLKNAGIIQQLGEGVKAKYAIVTRKFLQATYYANMAAHHLYRGAFIELALLKIIDVPKAKRQHAFWDEIMRVRDLFKFEFFYSKKSLFTDEIEQDLSFLDPDWENILNGSKDQIRKLLTSQGILVSQAVLSMYVEAYQVVGRALQEVDPEDKLSDQLLLETCMFLGDELHWQGRIHRIESVSKPLIINGIRLARNLDLIPDRENRKAKKIQAFIDDLKELYGRIHELQEIVISKKTEAKIVPIDQRVVPGSKTEVMTSTVIGGESGAHIGAFFDLDRTLIRGFSAKQFFQSRLLSGRMTTSEIVSQFGGVMVYAMGNRNFAGLAAIGAKGVKGVEEKVFIEVGEEVFYKELASEIYPESRALVDAHLSMGHTVAIISAATPYQVNPIARDLGVEHVMCTRMEVTQGIFTGNIIEPVCWGEGKSIAAKDLANRFNLDLSKSYFYTDSAEDLPLLDLVGNPRPVNPDRVLSNLAYQREWPVYRFDDEKRPTAIASLMRTLFSFGTIFPAAGMGVLSGLSSGSWKDGVNSMIGIVGDIGTKIAGLTVVVRGEEYLWSQRPAIFLFNHQSNADFLIVAKLLKKDVVAIAKKELEKSPVGPIFKMAGVIFIDRKNREKAIEAMKPAIDTLKNGTSIAIAPEGTRSYNYQLGPFKKGAFHLAMQAGVPVVPIVIKNAHDVMPRGSAFMQPSIVEVTVLPPVSSKKWTKKNLDLQIEKIRNSYLNELGQIETQVSSSNGRMKKLGQSRTKK